MKLLISAALLSVLCYTAVSSADLTIPCLFDAGNVPDFGSFYRCSVTDVKAIRRGEKFITSTGVHSPKLTADDVNVVAIVLKKVKFLPKGLETVFKNVEWLHISTSELLEITGEDLKPFPALKTLDLPGNKIDVILPELFKDNQKLEVINFANNKLIHVDATAFDNLPELRSLDLTNVGGCVSENAVDKKYGVRLLVKAAIEKCYSDVIVEYLKDKKTTKKPDPAPAASGAAAASAAKPASDPAPPPAPK